MLMRINECEYHKCKRTMKRVLDQKLNALNHNNGVYLQEVT